MPTIAGAWQGFCVSDREPLWGDCYDNSMIESFWSRMQVELLDRRKWNTRLELANAMFEYLEIWHNRKRRHSQLGWLTPIEFERNRIITVA